MNPDTGTYHEIAAFFGVDDRATASLREVDERLRALSVLTNGEVYVEGSREQVEAASRAIRERHDRSELEALRRETEKRLRRRQR